MTPYDIIDLISIGSGNGFLPAWQQAITWSNINLLSSELSVTYSSEIWVKMQNFSLKKMHFEI